MDGDTGCFGFADAGNDDSRSDADIYACDVDNRDSEGLVCCTEEKAMGGLWEIFMVMPAAVFLMMYLGNAFAPYQKARIQAVFSNSGDVSYLTATLRFY